MYNPQKRAKAQYLWAFTLLCCKTKVTCAIYKLLLIIHIPNKDYRMVRYYGFYNKCHDTLDEINKLLNKSKSKYQSYLEKKKILKQKLDKLKFKNPSS